MQLNKFYILLITAALFLQGNRVVAQQSLCEGSITPYSVDLTENGGNGSTGSTYTWYVVESTFQGSISNDTSSGNQITVDWGSTPPGNYTLVVEEETLGCVSTKQLDVSIGNGFTIELEDQYVCPNNDQLITLDAGAGYDSYEWSFNNQVIGNSQLVNVSNIGTYSLTVHQGSCEAMTDVNVNQVNLPFVDLQINNNTIWVYATGSNSNLEYQLETIEGQIVRSWQSNPIFSDVEMGRYQVRIRTEDGGCEITEGVNLWVIPNIITPNGDGINDVWDLSFLSDYDDQTYVEIYDRYGKKIHTINSSTNYIWDAFYLENHLHSTTYWYSIVLSSGEVIKGYVVIRNRDAK